MNGWDRRKIIVTGFLILAGGVALGLLTGLFRPTTANMPEGKFRVAMAGRSVMEHWFKYWNWPGILHDHTIYRPWPIPYTRYTKGGYSFEYVPVEAPHKNTADNRAEYGEKMLQSIRSQLEGKDFDALFFKFCFVDFSDKRLNDENAAARHLEKMTSLVERVHAFTNARHMTLLLANALPIEMPGDYAQKVRLNFNAWAADYAAAHHDVVLIDLFHPLTVDPGVLKPDYARAPDDPHLNRKGYKSLDDELFLKLQQAEK